MGMYTEICINCRLNLPDDVVGIIRYMLNNNDQKPQTLPEHDLFKTDRWSYMLTCSSYYFVPRIVHIFEYDDIGNYWCLMSISNFKNYDNEVDLFFDWLMPYIEAPLGEMIGYSRYEEDKEPVIRYKLIS